MKLQSIRLVLVISLVLLVGCAHKVPLERFAQENQAKINKLAVGMSKSEVVTSMGINITLTSEGSVSNPFRSEIFQDKSGVQYEILYYVTEENRPFQPIKTDQLTPLIVKNGVLIGWGAESLRRAMELAK